MKDFGDAAVVQTGLGGDVARREASLPGPLEAFAALGAGPVSLALCFLKRGLEATHVGSGFLLGSAHDCRSLRAGAAP
jgi:hypothetical protein